MDEGRTLVPLLLVVGLAFLVPVILSRLRSLRVPVVVGEIIAGIVIGRSGLQWVHEDPTLEVLAALGFAFLMFLSGLEIDFSMLLDTGRNAGSRAGNPAIMGSLVFLLTLGGTLSIAFGLTTAGLVENPWMLALILSTTSLGIVLPVLREQGLSSSAFGQTVLLGALVADFATMVLITVVVAVLSGGLTLEVLLVGLLLVAFVLSARFASTLLRWRPLRRILDELTYGTVQIKVRGALAVMFTFVVLSEVLGAEVILGAFLAGALIALISRPEDMDARHKLDAIGFGFIVPIFFIMVGVRFDLPALLASPSALLLFPVLLVAAYAVKLLPALVLQASFGRRRALAAGVLLSSRLSLIVAASAIGMQLGIIDEALNADIILVAVVTSTLSPALFGRLLPKSEAPPDPQKVMIVGAGRAGVLLAQRLSRHGDPIVIVDSDMNRLARVKQAGFPVIQANAANPVELEQAGIERTRALVVATSDDDFNLAVGRLARSRFGIHQVISYLQDATRLREFETQGIQAVNPVLASASVMDSLVRFPDAYHLLTALDDDKDVVEIEIRNPACSGRQIREMILPGDVLVLAIRRDDELFVPHGHNRLEAGDHVTLLGTTEAVAEATAWLQQHYPSPRQSVIAGQMH